MAAGNVVAFPSKGAGSSAHSAGTGPGGATGGGGGGGGSGNGIGPTGNAVFVRAVQGIRKAEAKVDETAQATYAYVRASLENKGGNLINADGIPYLFDGVDGRVYKISKRNSDFIALLCVRYGLFRAEMLTNHVISALEAFAISEGRPVPIRRFAHFDRDTNTLYMSNYNGRSHMLDGSGHLGNVPNGTGALFLDDDQGITTTPLFKNNGVIFSRLINDLQYVDATASGLTPAAQRCLLSIWMLALPFGTLLPAKPLLLVEGDKGSGKTAAIQRIQAALHGHVLAQSVGQHGEEDFGVTLLRSPIALIDNTDTYIEWLRDALCAYVTGGGWLRRKKYSDDEQIEIRPQSFVALATKNPATFRRDDVADRCLILRLDRRADKGGYVPMEQLLQDIKNDRSLIFGEYLWYLDAIVAEIRKGIAPTRSRHRLADFARIAHVIGGAVGINPTDIDDALDAAQAERDMFVVEGDPLTDLLDRWLETAQNQGRSIKALDLFAELSELGKKLKTGFYKTSKTLVDRLRTNSAGLATHFEIKETLGMYVIRRA